MKTTCWLFFLILTAQALADNSQLLSSIKEVNRFAFGSCNKQYFSQPLWPAIIKDAPDLWLSAGDNVYVNNEDPDKIKEAYENQNLISDYVLFKSITPIIGMWDDHDFTNDNANGNYRHKELSQKYFLNFFQEPLFSKRRTQRGIYTSYSFGPAERRIKFILLDTRFFKDVNPEAPILGKDQWRWLERELKDSRAKLIFLASGYPVMAPNMPMSVEWADYPGEKQKLLSMVGKIQTPLLFLTGDKHFSSIYRSGDYVEFMSSGMTHNTRLPLRPYVRQRFPNYTFNNNFGVIDMSWERSNPTLNLAVKGIQGETIIGQKLRWTAGKWLKL